MSESSLQDRLREHAKAFDGLLSLIPAKMYYGEDNTDQWKKKKQTKAEAKASKRGKLDPDSELNRNAKEVMDEKARNKRKLREMQEEDADEDAEEDEKDEASHQDDDDDGSLDLDVDKERPGEGLKKKPPKSEVANKKQKISDDAQDTQDTQDSQGQPSTEEKPRIEKKSAKKQKTEEKKKEEKKTEKKSNLAEKKDGHSETPSNTELPRTKGREAGQDGKASKDEVDPSKNDVKVSIESEARETEPESDLRPIDVTGLADEEETAIATTSSASTPASGPGSPVFDNQPGSNAAEAEPASTTTSISSTVTPSEKPKHIKLPTDTTALRARLAAKIEALRAARKADADGKPIRTRQELIEARREKQTQRKAHKKELRRLAKVEEERKREEALASARNSPAMLSPMVGLDDDDDSGNANHFAFGRVAFADGAQMSHDLSYEKDTKKRKGPSDPKTALAKLEAQRRRVEGLDEGKRKEVLEKEAWLAARRRAEGERIRDDEALLKKAVKRKDKAKKKSEQEWKERTKGVETAMAERQRKREENLRKRREEKGVKGKKKKGVASKKKNRPGFEGSFAVGGGKRK